MYNIIQKIKLRDNLFTSIGRYLFNLIKIYLISDRIFIKLTFRINHGYHIDLNNPKSLNEKIQWLKLYDRTPLHTQCADKFKVRDYVSEKIGEEYLIPLYFFTKQVSDISGERLADFIPCIVKTNHDSSGGIIFKNLNNQNWDEHQNKLNRLLKKSYYLQSKEWQYKNIERGIVVEKLLQSSKGEIPFDYKVHCFNGKPRMIQVDLNRGTNSYSRNWYTTNWEKTPFGWYAEKDGEIKRGANVELPRPRNLVKMLELSQKLSSDFVYVRIDWYDVDGKLYFGEVTFHQDSGLRPFEPKKWDLILGNELNLNSIKK